jgi:hypothetical protein
MVNVKERFCYEFRKENGKKEERLRRKEWILLKEVACSIRLLSYLGIRGAKNLQSSMNQLQLEYQNHPILSYLYNTRTNKKLTNITTTSNCYNC